MSNIIIIPNGESLNISSKWLVDESKKNGIVDQNGHLVGTNYNGQRFKVLCEAKFSDSVFRKTRLGAILAIIFSFGIAYCSKNIQSALRKPQPKLFISPLNPESTRVNDVMKENFKLSKKDKVKIDYREIGTDIYPIDCDVNSLGFDVDDLCRYQKISSDGQISSMMCTFHYPATHIINYINQSLGKDKRAFKLNLEKDKKSVKVPINPSKNNFYLYDWMGIVQPILEALRTNGHIVGFNLSERECTINI